MLDGAWELREVGQQWKLKARGVVELLSGYAMMSALQFHHSAFIIRPCFKGNISFSLFWLSSTSQPPNPRIRHRKKCESWCASTARRMRCRSWTITPNCWRYRSEEHTSELQ